MSDARTAGEPGPEDDDALVQRAKTDRVAFGTLFDRYYPAVARYCLRRIADRATAEDVTSEVFLQVASHLGAFAGRTESEFRRWVFTIATNAIAAHGRQTRRRAELWQAAAQRGQLDRRAGDYPLSVEHDPLDWPAVRAAIDELDEREQTIVELRFFAGCSHEEIAGVVDSTVGAVRTALARALARLRAKLNPLDPR